MEYIIGVVIIVAVIGIYVWTYSLNQKIEKPEGCEEVSCSGCKVDNCVSRK